MMEGVPSEGSRADIRRTVGLFALLNSAYFGVEFAVASAIGSVALFADSVDFLEDASVNLLIVLALAWSEKIGPALV
jgi:Co/Zn/Cd efflux system component